MPNQRSFSVLIVLLGVVFLVALAYGGYYFYSRKSVSSSASAVPSPTIAASPSSIASSTPESSSSADLSDYATFDSPCVSLKYPKDWKKIEEKIETTHKIAKSKDFYGATSLWLSKTIKTLVLNNETFNFQFFCNPNIFNADIKKIEEIDKANDKPEQNTPQDSIQRITIDGVDATKVVRNTYTDLGRGGRIGTVTISEVRGNYTLDIHFGWPDASGNDLSLSPQKDVQNMMDSIHIKEVFGK